MAIPAQGVGQLGHGESVAGKVLGIDSPDTIAVQYGKFLPDFLARPLTQAVRSVTLSIEGLAANAVVRTLDLLITSRPADRARLDTTQVRSYPSSDESNAHLVSVAIDFGTMVTVSAVATPVPTSPPGGPAVAH
ncbi:MAG TPA: hypothetical protein VFK02_19275, partial [Kofleriaceae bacterium]|nr:hypothetical protein [Kofleriaceae bacterium]